MNSSNFKLKHYVMALAFWGCSIVVVLRHCFG